MRGYLAGSIEFSDDGGREWRQRLRAFLQKDLGHDIYDPAEDETKNLTENEVANFRQWKSTNFERYRTVVRKIINYDLDIIETRTDYVICYWEAHSGRGGGTPAELTTAYRNGIPVFLVTEVPLVNVSGWVLSCADQVFTSFEGLKKFLAIGSSRALKTKKRSQSTRRPSNNKFENHTCHASIQADR
jgi:hypothetical protein